MALFDNLQRIMRINNVFNPQAADEMSAPQVPIQEPPPEDYTGIEELVNQMYNPQTSSMERFENLMNEYPTRQEPSGLRKLGAALVGAFEGSERGREALNAPFNQELLDWKAKITPAAQAMTQERLSNVNERQLALQTAANTIREKANANKAKIDAGKLEVERKRANIYDWKAKHPDLKITQPKGGFITAVNPLTGESSLVRDDKGQPIATGTLTDEDMLNLQQENRLATAAKTIEGQKEVEKLRQEGREWSDPVNIQDPDDPTKTIAVQTNRATGETRRVTLGGKQVGPIAKPSGAAGAAGGRFVQPKNLDTIRDTARKTKEALNLVMDENGKLRNEVKGVVGGSRMVTSPFGFSVPGTEARSANAKINRLKNLITIDLIGEMKSQSRTGATGFGNMSNKDLGVLENAASMLDAGIEEPEFEKELQRINRHLDDILKDQEPEKPVEAPGTKPGELPKGRIKVTNPSGKEVYIDLEQWPEAQKQGYKKAY